MRVRRNKIENCDNIESNSDYTNKEETKCTQTTCIKDNNEDCLKCSDCSRLVHYECTQLPAYYISLILSKKKSHKFVCASCVDVPKTLAEKIRSKQQDADEIERLRREVKNCDNVIQIAREKELKLIADSEKQHSDLQDLKRKLRSDPSLHTTEYLEERFEKRVKELGIEIRSSIVEELKAINNTGRESYAIAAKKDLTSDNKIKHIIREAKKEEVREVQNKISRAKNIIVHGVPETQPTQGEEEENKDAEFIKNMVSDLRVIAHVKYAGRIGKLDNQKNRPIKVAFESEKEKISILQSLCNLKQYEGYKGVSITDDFTPSERGMIK